MRLVSLVPSSTETLLALGANVLACTNYCEQPQLQHVGGTKNPNIDAIVALDADVVVMDREENRREDAEALQAAGVDIFVSDVTDIATAHSVTSDLAALVGATFDVPAAPVVQPIDRTVFVPIWRRPWMGIHDETYGAALLRHLGCQVVTGGPGRYPTVDLAVVAAAAPDMVVVPSEPYDFSDAHLRELEGEIPAAEVRRVDGQDLFWWGIRTNDAIERLHDALR